MAYHHAIFQQEIQKEKREREREREKKWLSLDSLGVCGSRPPENWLGGPM